MNGRVSRTSFAPSAATTTSWASFRMTCRTIGASVRNVSGKRRSCGSKAGEWLTSISAQIPSEVLFLGHSKPSGSSDHLSHIDMRGESDHHCVVG
jgi:hypothetical protein